MIRRLNYTGRRRLPQKDFNIRILPGAQRRFQVNFDASVLQFPGHAKLYFEAYSSGQTAVLRFPWGTVSTPAAAGDTSLTALTGDTVLFVFKVVDETGHQGRILGICGPIPVAGAADGVSGKRSMLPVNVLPLGQQVWRLAIDHDTPWLELNSVIPDIKERAQRDPGFFALVYPALIRQLLTAVFARKVTDPSDTTRWESNWLRWAMLFHPERSEPPALRDEPGVEHAEWIDDVVEAFCRHYSIADKFTGAVAAETAGTD